jgi:hypothetical protein
VWSSIALVFFLILFFYKRKIVLYSPVDLFVIYYALVLFFTLLYQNFIPYFLKVNLYNFDRISSYRCAATTDVFVVMIILFILGTFTYKTLNKKHYKTLQIIPLQFNTTKISAKSDVLQKAMFVFLFVAMVLVFLDYGLELFSRPKYLPNKASTYKTIYQVLFIFISFLSGILYHKKKHSSLFAIVITILVGFSMGSRFASVNLILYGFTIFVFIKSRFSKIFFLIWFTIFVFFFFGFNLSLRSETNVHGLFPYAMLVFEKPEILYLYALKNVYYSFIFGYYATADTIKEYAFYSWDTLWTCLNPLPGRMTNWYAIANRMRSNIYAPFTAIGELAKYKGFFILYYFMIGYYFTKVDFFIKSSFQNKKYLLPILHLLLLIMFIIFSFEYNLRSANRYIYYSIFLFAVVYVMKKLSQKKIVYHGKE